MRGNEFLVLRVIENAPRRFDATAGRAEKLWLRRDWDGLSRLARKLIPNANVCADWRSRLRAVAEECELLIADGGAE